MILAVAFARSSLFPQASRLIGFDAWPTNFLNEQAADGQGVVANHLG